MSASPHPNVAPARQLLIQCRSFPNPENGLHADFHTIDVEEGGETAFSKSAWLNETAQRTAQPSECAAAKVFVKPRKGDALLFWDLKPDGQTGEAAKLPCVSRLRAV